MPGDGRHVAFGLERGHHAVQVFGIAQVDVDVEPIVIRLAVGELQVRDIGRLFPDQRADPPQNPGVVRDRDVQCHAVDGPMGAVLPVQVDPAARLFFEFFQRRAVDGMDHHALSAKRDADYSFARHRLATGGAAKTLILSQTHDGAAFLDLVARGGAQGVFHGMHENDLRRFATLPHTMFASDSGPRRFNDGVPHPRGYGNNARILGRYVRELGLLSVEEAVRKMTSLPAQTFRLKNRGELRPGFVADVVVFDPAKVSDPSTFSSPHAYAIGFDDVIVNGVPVIRAGTFGEARPGRPVRLQDS